MLELKITIVESNNVFRDTLKLLIPKIKSVELDCDSLIPYTSYPLSFVLTMDNSRIYRLNPSSNWEGLQYDHFRIEDSTLFSVDNNLLTYHPKTLDHDSITIRIIHPHLVNPSSQKIKVPKHFSFTINHSGFDGTNGFDGYDGYDGDDGEDGGNGGDGDDGENGGDGNNIEILVRNDGLNTLKILVFDDQNYLYEYLGYKNSTIIINCNGGNGGDGGSGGDAGTGGGEDEDGHCGSDGIDGSRGNGGLGGNGGNVKIFTDLGLQQLAFTFEIKNSGGEGGSGLKNGSNGKKGTIEYSILSTSKIEVLFKKYESAE